ncbi:MAG: hypothetical protein M1818_007744 [Claussenomyces sp. TS43310]|nr:MAG: hypothetical protein M1818_007744 [Claussenomyces sp. TS43310]
METPGVSRLRPTDAIKPSLITAESDLSIASSTFSDKTFDDSPVPIQGLASLPASPLTPSTDLLDDEDAEFFASLTPSSRTGRKSTRRTSDTGEYKKEAGASDLIKEEPSSTVLIAKTGVPISLRRGRSAGFQYSVNPDSSVETSTKKLIRPRRKPVDSQEWNDVPDAPLKNSTVLAVRPRESDPGATAKGRDGTQVGPGFRPGLANIAPKPANTSIRSSLREVDMPNLPLEPPSNRRMASAMIGTASSKKRLILKISRRESSHDPEAAEISQIRKRRPRSSLPNLVSVSEQTLPAPKPIRPRFKSIAGVETLQNQLPGSWQSDSEQGQTTQKSESDSDDSDDSPVQGKHPGPWPSASEHVQTSPTPEPRSNDRLAQVQHSQSVSMALRPNQTGVQSAGSRARRTQTETSTTVSMVIFEKFNNDLSDEDINNQLFSLLGRRAKEKASWTWGWIYILTSPSCPGKVKIGFTELGPHVRRDQWKKCGHELKLAKDENDKPFAHAGLVERLIHQELCNKRYTFQCSVCKGKHNDCRLPRLDRRSQAERSHAAVLERKVSRRTRHKEWFEVSEEVALQTVEKWRGWIVQNDPYGYDGQLRRGWEEKYARLGKNLKTVDWNTWRKPLTVQENLAMVSDHLAETTGDTWPVFQGLSIRTLEGLLWLRDLGVLILKNPKLFSHLFFVSVSWSVAGRIGFVFSVISSFGWAARDLWIQARTSRSKKRF